MRDTTEDFLTKNEGEKNFRPDIFFYPDSSITNPIIGARSLAAREGSSRGTSFHAWKGEGWIDVKAIKLKHKSESRAAETGSNAFFRHAIRLGVRDCQEEILG